LNGINFKAMKILLIGGTGVLSSAVTNEAIKKGISVTMINRGHRRNLIPNNVVLITADKDQKQIISESLKNQKFDAIIDFLCYTKTQLEESFNFYSKYTSQYFFISSGAVYNNSIKGVFDESHPKVSPLWNYSVDKWACEQSLIDLAHKSSTNYTIIRPAITYGNTRIPYGIAPSYGFHWTLILRILSNKPIIRWNKGQNCRNMTRVEDFAVGLVGLIGNPKAYNEAFNICGDETPTYNDVLNVLSEYTNHPVQTADISSEFYAQEVPSRSGEILVGRSIDAVNSNQKIKDAVPEFRQTIFLKEGIYKTLDAYKNNNYQNGIDWKFDAQCDRIAKKWNKLHKIKPAYKIGFVDYLGNATIKNRYTYYQEFYADNRFAKFIFRVINKLVYILSSK
jgi:nucleoside-diphosphate-sugar epimerase